MCVCEYECECAVGAVCVREHVHVPGIYVFQLPICQATSCESTIYNIALESQLPTFTISPPSVSSLLFPVSNSSRLFSGFLRGCLTDDANMSSLFSTFCDANMSTGGVSNTVAAGFFFWCVCVCVEVVCYNMIVHLYICILF